MTSNIFKLGGYSPSFVWCDREILESKPFSSHALFHFPGETIVVEALPITLTENIKCSVDFSSLVQ